MENKLFTLSADYFWPFNAENRLLVTEVSASSFSLWPQVHFNV